MKNKWLIDKRNELGLTQQDLANKTGVHRSYIAMIEKGTRTPSVKRNKCRMGYFF